LTRWPSASIPSTSHFVFTANFTPDGVYGTVSDFSDGHDRRNAHQYRQLPYKGNAQLTAVAAIPHGSSQK